MVTEPLLLFVYLLFWSPAYCWSPDASHGSETATILHLQSLEDYSSAVCNDGTPGGYYFAPSSDARGKDVFVVHLPGGGQCYSQASCAARWARRGHNHMSSKGFKKVAYKTGILDSSPSVTPLWAANKAMIGYCSSDGYIGNVGASNKTWGYHFRGQQLVFATIRDLISRHGLSHSSTVILAGNSAGARGVMALADHLIAYHLPQGCRVVAFMDSPTYVDVPTYRAGGLNSQSHKGFQFEEKQRYNLFNISGPTPVQSQHSGTDRSPAGREDDALAILPEQCLRANRGHEWRCLFGQYRLPYVSTPHLVLGSQFDSYQLKHNTQLSDLGGRIARDYGMERTTSDTAHSSPTPDTTATSSVAASVSRATAGGGGSSRAQASKDASEGPEDDTDACGIDNDGDCEGEADAIAAIAAVVAEAAEASLAEGGQREQEANSLLSYVETFGAIHRQLFLAFLSSSRLSRSTSSSHVDLNTLGHAAANTIHSRMVGSVNVSMDGAIDIDIMNKTNRAEVGSISHKDSSLVVPVYAYFFVGCYNHDLSDTLGFRSISANGVSQKKALQTFLDAAGMRHVYGASGIDRVLVPPAASASSLSNYSVNSENDNPLSHCHNCGTSSNSRSSTAAGVARQSVEAGDNDCDDTDDALSQAEVNYFSSSSLLHSPEDNFSSSGDNNGNHLSMSEIPAGNRVNGYWTIGWIEECDGFACGRSCD